MTHIPLGLSFVGLDQHLTLGTIKDHVSALSILFQRQLTFHSLNKTFVQRGLPCRSLVHSPMTLWHLNLFLSVLQKLSFKPIRDIFLSSLSHRVAFFVTIAYV